MNIVTTDIDRMQHMFEMDQAVRFNVFLEEVRYLLYEIIQLQPDERHKLKQELFNSSRRLNPRDKLKLGLLLRMG